MEIAQIPEAAHDWPDKVPDFAPLKINLGNQDSISDRQSDAGGAFFFPRLPQQALLPASSDGASQLTGTERHLVCYISVRSCSGRRHI